MAGDWTAIEHATPRKPEMLEIAGDTGRSRHEVLGLMVDFWAWAETQTDDGQINMRLSGLPEIIGADMTFWCAVVRAGWIELSPNETPETARQFTIPRADHWLSRGAKSRLSNSRRQATRRANVAQMSRRKRDKSATTEEKRTEEKRSIASAIDTPLPPTEEFVDSAERGEPDWVIEESRFIASWNACDGVALHSRSAFDADLGRMFRARYFEPGWLERANKAMAKFPLRNGIKISIRKFLQPTTVDEILGGVHDFDPNRRTSKPRTGAGQRFSKAATGNTGF